MQDDLYLYHRRFYKNMCFQKRVLEEHRDDLALGEYGNVTSADMGRKIKNRMMSTV